MSRLLDRATALISALGSSPGAPRTLHELAAAAGLPPATGTRILKRLVELGWADQDGNRGAYRIGPRAYALTAAAPYRRQLVERAVPAMRRLSAIWPRAGVVLVVLRPWCRQLLWECGAFYGAGLGDMRLVAGELWSGASGRVLVAALPAHKRNQWIDHVGLPGADVWPGIATRRELLAALADIRREGAAEVVLRTCGLHAAAVLVPDGADGAAALGVYLPVAPPAGLIAELRRAAADIAVPVPPPA